MRYREVLVEDAKIQHGLEVLARAILAALATTIPQKVAGYRSYHGSLDGIRLSDLGTLTDYHLQPKTIPMPVRRLVRKLSVSLSGEDSFANTFGSFVIKLTAPQGLTHQVISDAELLRPLLQTLVPNLVHELSHAWDDLRSKGRYVRNRRSAATKARFATYADEPSEAHQAAWSRAYIRDPAEINAAFQAAIAAIPMNASFDAYATAFYDRLPQFSAWPPTVQARMRKRLYKQWSALRDRD